MPENGILRSWKEIANYLKCDRKTCARWEAQFGLPIHRIDPESPRSRVFAYPEELDDWMAERQSRLDTAAIPGTAEQPKKRKIPSLALALTILVVSGPVAWITIRNVFRSPFPPIVAVAPFEAPKNDVTFDYIAEGLKMQLIERLSLSGDVLVMRLPAGVAGSMDSDGGGLVPPRTDYIIRNEIAELPEKDKFRWTLHLIDFEKKQDLWDMTYQADTPGLFQNISEAVSGIRRALDLGEIPKPTRISRDVTGAFVDTLRGSFILSKIGSKDKDTNTLYLEGKYYSNLGDEQANELAILSFQNALLKDPAFGPGLIGLAACYTNYVNFGWKTDLAWLDKAEELLSRANPYSQENPEFYRQSIETRMLRDFFSGRESFPAYFELAARGQAISPYHGGLNSIVGFCHFRRYELYGQDKDLDEALRLKELAYLAEPYSINNIVYAQVLTLKRRFSDALGVCAQVQQVLKTDFVTLQAAEAHYYQGDMDACEPAFASIREDLSARTYALSFLGMIAAQRGNRAAAEEALREIELSAPQNSEKAIGKLRRASIYAGLGDEANALDLMAQIFQPDSKNGGNYVYRRLIELDRNFENLRPRIKLYY